ncbi:MAG: 3-dehydroquinate synthase [Desulfuromonas sp.]
MESLTVGLGARSYAIHVGADLLTALPDWLKALQLPRRVMLVSNQVVAPLYLSTVECCLAAADFQVLSVILPDGEASKNAASLEQIYTSLIRSHCDRQTLLVALGGGVVGDITGFAAATYLRGVPFVQLPTSLLAQVDSSVGGKTAINHPLGKNLIGAFYQPRLVLIDVKTLQTLPARELSAGLAEVIKYGVIADANFFHWLELHSANLRRLEQEFLIEAVLRCCRIKAAVVAEDETEQGQRALLNYGHTFGHAIEQLCGYGQVLHGEAVAMGMVVAARIAERQQLCRMEDVQRIRELIAACGLPLQSPSLSLDACLEVMLRDKKVTAGRLRMVLNEGIGSAKLVEIADPGEVFAVALAPELLHG